MEISYDNFAATEHPDVFYRVSSVSYTPVRHVPGASHCASFEAAMDEHQARLSAGHKDIVVSRYAKQNTLTNDEHLALPPASASAEAARS